MNIYDRLQKKEKHFAILVDPDDVDERQLEMLVKEAKRSFVSFFFVGGSLLIRDKFEKTITFLKKRTNIPVVIFPGDTYQISPRADAILFLSLISGRNADLLIGKHVLAAPYVRKSGLQVLPTGYMLIDSGRTTTASYMSHSQPIPRDKTSIAVATAMAGEMLGMKLIYMDGGSGAEHQISTEMIRQVKKNISVPLIIGGGINNKERAKEILDAGADVIVVGTAIEQNPDVVGELGTLFS